MGFYSHRNHSEAGPKQTGVAILCCCPTCLMVFMGMSGWVISFDDSSEFCFVSHFGFHPLCPIFKWNLLCYRNFLLWLSLRITLHVMCVWCTPGTERCVVPKIEAAPCNDSQHQFLISESNLGLNLSIQTVYMDIHHYHSKWIKQLEFIIHLRCEH